MPDGIVVADILTLGGGRVVAQIHEKLDQAIDDVLDRPGLNNARVVTLKINIKPNLDPTDGLNYPEISTTVSATLPGITIEESAIVRGGKAYLSTARQTELDLPDNVEPIVAENREGNGEG